MKEKQDEGVKGAAIGPLAKLASGWKETEYDRANLP